MIISGCQKLTENFISIFSFSLSFSLSLSLPSQGKRGALVGSGMQLCSSFWFVKVLAEWTPQHLQTRVFAHTLFCAIGYIYGRQIPWSQPCQQNTDMGHAMRICNPTRGGVLHSQQPKKGGSGSRLGRSTSPITRTSSNHAQQTQNQPRGDAVSARGVPLLLAPHTQNKL